MCFVDGTNFFKRVKEQYVLQVNPLKAPVELFELAFLWIGRAEAYLHFNLSAFDRIIPVRRYWFSSYQGDVSEHDRISTILRSFRFEPRLYKKDGNKEKGVDIGLAKEMLVNSFNQNFDLGTIIAGDEDYLELITEVKRYGPILGGGFIKSGLSPKIRLSFDLFCQMDEMTDQNKKEKELIDKMKTRPMECP